MTQDEINQKMLIWLQTNLPKQTENSKFWRLAKIPSFVDSFEFLSNKKAEKSQTLPNKIISNSKKIKSSFFENSNLSDAKKIPQSNSYNTIIPKSIPKNSQNKKIHRSELKVENIGANYGQKLTNSKKEKSDEKSNILPKIHENETKNSQNSKITSHKILNSQIANSQNIFPKQKSIISFKHFGLPNSAQITKENSSNLDQKIPQRNLITTDKIGQKTEDISKNSSTIIQNTTILKSKTANFKISQNPKIIQIDQIKEVLETVNSKIKPKNELKSKMTSSNAQTNQKLWQKLQKLKIPNLSKIVTSIPTKIDFGKSYQKVVGL